MPATISKMPLTLLVLEKPIDSARVPAKKVKNPRPFTPIRNLHGGSVAAGNRKNQQQEKEEGQARIQASQEQQTISQSGE